MKKIILLKLLTSLICGYAFSQENKTIIINEGLEAEATLLFREEFNNDLSNWVVETDLSVGSVHIDNGKLDLEVDSGCVVWYKEWLKGPVMIEFDAVPIDEGGVLDNVSDLNSFILASDLDGNPVDFFNESEERGSSGAHLSLYDPFGMYYVGHGGGSNSRTRFRRYDGEGERPLLAEHHLEGEEYLLKANENHHIRIIVYGNTFQYYVNDLLVYNWEDPYEAYSEGYYGFRTINTHWELDNYEFYSLTERACSNTADLLEAECFDQFSGIKTEESSEGGTNVGYINNDDWTMYQNIDLTDRVSIEARVASKLDGGSIEVRLNSETGQLIGTVDVINTGGWQNWETVSANISSVTGIQDVYFVYKGEGDGYLLNVNWFKFIESTITTVNFTPDPNKTYYIDAPHHNLRLAANGESEDAYTTSTNTTGADVEWSFVLNANGYWHIQRAAGGSMPRLRTDNSEYADMQDTSYSGAYTYYELSNGYIDNTFFLTLPDGPSDYQRLQINGEGNTRFVPTSHALTWESFSITEASSLAEFSRIEAEDFDAMSGVQTEQSTESGENVGWINDGDWIRFDAINLTGAQNVDVRVASNFNGGTVEIRTGSNTGNLIGSINVSNTGGNQNWVTLSTNINNVSGTQDVYLVFTGGSGYLFNVNWLEFSSSSASAKSITDVATNNIVIYPNPVVLTTTIKGAANSTLEVYDIEGALLVTKNIISETEEVNLGNLSSGIYYAKVSSQHNVDVIKIVKQ